MTLAQLAASIAVALPFNGDGLRIEPYSGAGPCGSGAAGCVWSDRPRTIYCQRSYCDSRWVLSHELGHSLDFEFMTRYRREKWARRYRGAWHPERFAETYAACATRQNATGSYYGARLYHGTRKGRSVCRAIRYWSRVS